MMVMSARTSWKIWTATAATVLSASAVQRSVGATAAFVTSSSSSQLRSFGVSPIVVRRPQHCRRSNLVRPFSSNNDNDGGGGGLFGAVGKIAKSVMPTSWFRSEKEKKAAMQRQKVKDEVKGNLSELLKDAPLPVRMFGGLVAPLMSSVMSGLAETMAEQEETVRDYMGKARSFILRDDAVIRALGEPVQVGTPFSQSSSTTTINGKTTSVVELGFPVQGRLGSGMGRLSATGEGIQRLEVQAGGRTIRVDTSNRGGGGAAGGGRRFTKGNNDDTIIEAEIIEKDTKP